MRQVGSDLAMLARFELRAARFSFRVNPPIFLLACGEVLHRSFPCSQIIGTDQKDARGALGSRVGKDPLRFHLAKDQLDKPPSARSSVASCAAAICSASEKASTISSSARGGSGEEVLVFQKLGDDGR